MLPVKWNSRKRKATAPDEKRLILLDASRDRKTAHQGQQSQKSSSQGLKIKMKSEKKIRQISPQKNVVQSENGWP